MKHFQSYQKKQILDGLKKSGFSAKQIETIEELLEFLSETELRKGNRIYQSIENRKTCISRKNYYANYKNLYNKLPIQILPFVTWIIHISIFFVLATYIIIKVYKGEKEVIGLFLASTIALSPFLILKIKTWKDFKNWIMFSITELFNWIRNVVFENFVIKLILLFVLILIIVFYIYLSKIYP